MTATHTKLIELLRNAKTRHPFLDQERRDAARIGLGIGLGIHHERVRIRAVRDPHLGTIQQIVGALRCRP